MGGLLRTVALLGPLVIGAGFDTTTSAQGNAVAPEPVSMSMSVLPPAPAPVVMAMAATVAEQTGVEPVHPVGKPSLHEIQWTVGEEESVDALASRWGIKRRALVELNSELRGKQRVKPGMRLWVYRANDSMPTRSVGAPNSGRLEHGMPMPEGSFWKLRERRTRAFGATNAIEAMVTAFTEYGRSFDDAPLVSVGEISARRGGKAAPHRSHRTGRDVDIGYILSEGMERERWQRADANNFDVERNWALIRALVETGEVQQIFISVRLQRLLRPLAERELSEAEFARYFRVPGDERDMPPILKHWDGHRDHMHVRFRCGSGESRCRSRSKSGRS